MSRTKDLKTNPEFNINLFELFSLFSIDKKTKYTETLLRVMKKTPNIEEHCDEIIKHFHSEFNISIEDLNNVPRLQLVLFYRIVDSMFNTADIKTFKKFCEYNERGLIKQNDVSTYNYFEEINSAVDIAEISAISKDLEKQVKVIYEDDEWLFVRPLTFNASKKYGSNTKWCTNTESNPEYFVKYSGKGVLIYCLNKNNGYKVACFKSLDMGDPEFSWWDQKDVRIDSLQSSLSIKLLEVIRIECLNTNKTNRSLLSEDEKNKEDGFLKKYNQHKYSEEMLPSLEPIYENRAGRVRRAIERTIEEESEMGLTNENIVVPVRRLVEAYDDNVTEGLSEEPNHTNDGW